MTQQQFKTTVDGELNGLLSDGFRFIGDYVDTKAGSRTVMFRHSRNGSKMLATIFCDVAYFYRNGKLVNVLR